MDSHEQPEFSGDLSFSETETARFQTEVLWPAINRKWGKDFATVLSVGSYLSQQVPLYEDDPSQWCELSLSCQPDADEDGELVLCATLAIHRPNDDLLEGAKMSYLADRLKTETFLNRRKRKKLTRQIMNELESQPHSIREEIAYDFNPLDDGPFDIDKSIQLLDSDGDVIWDSSVTDVGEESDEETQLDELEDAFSQSIAKEDYFLIMDALVALGVPPEVSLNDG